MKLHALRASAVALALTLIATNARAADPDRDFISIMVLSYTVKFKCNISPDWTGIQRFADARGMDYDSLMPPIVNAIGSIVGAEYDRTKLNPTVTQMVFADMREIAESHGKMGEEAFCNKYGDFALRNGIGVRSSANASR